MEWLNYHHLYYFWLAVREGSMTKAASLVHVTPATLSVQIRELERAAANQLIKKSGRGFELTEMGEIVYRYATDIFALGEELKGAVRGQLPGELKILRVGVKDALPKLLAYKFLEPGLQLDSPMRLVCREGSVESLVAELAVHQLDVVFSDTPLDPSSHVQVYSHNLSESTITIVGARALAESYGSGFPEGISQAPWIMPTTDCMLRRSLAQWFSDQGIIADLRGEFEDAAMLKIAGQAGLGLFAVPTIVSAEVCKKYDVQPLGELPINVRYYALTVDRKLKHPSVQQIIQTNFEL